MKTLSTRVKTTRGLSCGPSKRAGAIAAGRGEGRSVAVDEVSDLGAQNREYSGAGMPEGMLACRHNADQRSLRIANPRNAGGSAASAPTNYRLKLAVRIQACTTGSAES